MENSEIIMYAIGAIVACVLYVGRVVLGYYKVEKAVRFFDKYKPYAMIASKKVEKVVPDDYGAGEEDPSTAKAVHKLDLFLKEFIKIVEMQEGETPGKLLKAEAMSWSVELAERQNLAKELTANVEITPKPVQ